MQRTFVGPIGVAAAALAAAVLLTPATSALAHDPALPECVVTLAEPIPVQPEPVVVEARLSAPLEGKLVAVLPQESRVTVVEVAPAEDEPMTARLTLRTAEATPGEWDLTLRGEAGGECTGKVKVAAE